MALVAARGQDLYLSKREMQHQIGRMAAMRGSLVHPDIPVPLNFPDDALPKKGKDVRIEYSDGSTVTLSLTDLDAASGGKLYLHRYLPAPGTMIEIDEPEAPPPFEGIVRCAVRGQHGFAFRDCDLDPLGRVLFVSDLDRRGFDRGAAWFGGISSQHWDLVTDISPATAADVASMEAWLERRRTGERPEAPPLDRAFAENFIASVPRLLETSMGYYIEQGMQPGQQSVDLFIREAAESGDPDLVALAKGFDDLWPIRRGELVRMAQEAAPVPLHRLW